MKKIKINLAIIALLLIILSISYAITNYYKPENQRQRIITNVTADNESLESSLKESLSIKIRNDKCLGENSQTGTLFDCDTLKNYIIEDIIIETQTGTRKQQVNAGSGAISGVPLGSGQNKTKGESKSKTPLKSGWRVNSAGISKPKSELGGSTFIDVTNAHGIPHNIWVVNEAKWGVKKEVALCIAWADSGLGRYLKTKNNIGNVGNNDRGDRVAYATIEQGVEVIFKVLNNRYLTHKQTIGSLSPGGGGTRPFYATSKENWNANVINCLSTIYGTPINEEFNIRT